MNKKSVYSAVVAFALTAFTGSALAQATSSTTTPAGKIANSQPSQNSGVASVGLSGPSLGVGGAIGGAIGGISISGGSLASGSNVKRYALTGDTGAAGAPATSLWNVWTAYSRSDVGYNFSQLQSSGKVDVFLAGVDYTLPNDVIVGVAVAKDRTNIDLNFSGGTLSGNGVTISPYFGVAINKNLSLDGTIGFGRTDITTNTLGVGGSSRSDRTIGSLGLTYVEKVDNWTLSARGALLSVNDKLGAYTLTNGTFVTDGTVKVTQLRVSGQAAYSLGTFTPFVGLALIDDINRPNQAPVNGIAAANARFGWTPTIGVRFKADSSVYGAIQYSSEQRSEVKNNQILFNLGIRF